MSGESTFLKDEVIQTAALYRVFKKIRIFPNDMQRHALHVVKTCVARDLSAHSLTTNRSPVLARKRLQIKELLFLNKLFS